MCCSYRFTGRVPTRAHWRVTNLSTLAMNDKLQWQPSDIMNAEAGSEPEAPKKRGRIPQSAWPEILERYRAGATLSAIAREFSCTPSAISYIVRKAEAATGSDGDEGHEDDAAPETETVAAPAPAPVERTVREAPAPAPVAEPAPERPARRMLTAASLVDSTPEPAPVLTPPPLPAATPAPAAPRAAGARPEPTPPVDEVEGRLRETARTCLAAYRGWRQTPGENSIQTLSDAVHELRKALARIEIDMSASRREEQAIRPIPIPSHRAARRPQ